MAVKTNQKKVRIQVPEISPGKQNQTNTINQPRNVTTPKAMTTNNSQALVVKKPKIESTWRKVRRVCEANEGRDKSMKIVQYAIRLATHTSRTYDDTVFSNIPGAQLDLLESLATRLSKTRVVIRLLKFFQKIDVLKDHKFSPNKALQEGKVTDTMECVDFVNACIGLSVDVLADVHFWSVMKFIPEHIHKKIDSVLAQIWFVTVVIDTAISFLRLSEISRKIRRKECSLNILIDTMDKMDVNSIKNGAYERKMQEKRTLERELQILRHKRLAMIIGFVKFIGDLGVAIVTAFRLPNKNGVKLSFGLVSGVASLAGMWRKNVV